ncbi:MAG: O-antigen ligase family protein [Verrucomicrobiae bacterium]|nr:O-antigen ligase family protein [Verrucomicrobiae bacterium]
MIQDSRFKAQGSGFLAAFSRPTAGDSARLLLIFYASSLFFKNTATLQAALLLSASILIFWDHRKNWRSTWTETRWVLGPLLVFSLWILLTSPFWREPPMNSWDPNSWDMRQPWFSLNLWKRDLAQPMLAMCCGYWAFRDDPWRRRIFTGLAFVLAALLVKCLIQYYAGEVADLGRSVSPENPIVKGTLWVRGFSRDNNAFSYILVLLTPAILWLVFYRPRGWRGWLAFAAALVLLYLLFINKRRGAWLAVYIELFILAFFMGRRQLAIFLIGTLIMTAAAYQVRPQWFVRDYDANATSEFEKNSSRDLIFKNVTPLIRQHPWVGVGYGKDTVVKNYWHKIYQHTHNAYLNVLLASGIPGLLIWLAALGTYAWRFWRHRALDWTARIGLAFLIGFYVRNLTDDIWTASLAELFWFLAGVLIPSRPQNEVEPSPRMQALRLKPDSV